MKHLGKLVILLLLAANLAVTGLLLEELLYKGWINARCGQL